MSDHYDAIVVGAGPNGLVAANRLADAGWSVLVLEAQPEVGGAVRSDRDVDPEFVHDTFSSFYPLAAASPAIRSFDLEQHGLTWRHAPAVLGHPLPDGDWALLHRDRDRTASMLEGHRPGDGEAWLELCAQWDVIGPSIVGALLSPFPPVRHGLGGLARVRRAGGLDLVRTLLTPANELGRTRFAGAAPRLLLAGNAGHADIPLDAPGSGLMGLLMSMLGQTVGFPVPEGGAGMLTQALARRLEGLGGQIHTGTEVVAIEVDRGRATAVRTAGGNRYGARRAVVADVTAPLLYRRLLDDRDVPAATARAMDAFQLDPGTVKVDWALDGPVPWRGTPVVAPGTVHVADSVEEMTESLGQVQAGAVPARPFLLAGQMTTTDPTRSPAGTESFWAYTHVPQRVRRDAGDGSGPRHLGPGRLRAVRGPDAGPDRGGRARLRQPGPHPPGARAARARGAQREPHRRRDQRRHRPAPPAAGLPAGPRLGPRRDADRRALPRLGVRAPRWRGARHTRHERRAGGAVPRPAAVAAAPR